MLNKLTENAQLNEVVATQFGENKQLPNGFTRRQIAFAVTPKIQELILFPTEQCNFRCTYCYEDFEIGKMSKKTQAAIENLLRNRIPNLKKLNFSWFGGEPLVAKDVVLRLSRFANELCKQYGVEFRGGLTTNAYQLSKKLAEELIECKQNFYQITLDGIGEEHDKLRRRADGKGTFDVIWRNLQSLHELPHQFECLLRIHVRRDNAENLEILMKEIARTFETDSRFRLDFQHLRDMGGYGGKSVVQPLSITELGNVEKNLRRVWRNSLPGHTQSENGNSVQEIETVISDADKASMVLKGESASARRSEDIVQGEPYVCYAARPNSIIIRANGRIGKCTVALSDNRNDLGYLAEDGSVVINNQKLLPWIRGLESLDDNEAGCPLAGMPSLNLSSPKPGEIIPIIAAAAT